MDLSFKLNLKSTNQNIVPDIGWLIYFTGMFCLYKFTYFQLAIQIGIILYSFFYKTFKDNYKIRIRYSTVRNLIFLCMWFGLLLVMLFISSKTYAVFKDSGSNTVLTTFRMFTIGLAMYYYADDTKAALSVMESMVIATFLMFVLVMIVTPPSMYFVATTANQTEGFGSRIAQHRNSIGCIGASMFIACYYLSKYSNFKPGKFICFFYVIVIVLSGSRSGLIQLAMEIALIMLFNANFSTFVIFALSVCLGLAVIRYVPILYENIWLRLIDAADTVTTGTEADSSAATRQYYKEIAWNMFLEKPFLGWGVDGFRGYLYYHPVYKNVYLTAVYSHCNYSELMSCLGIAGLAIWYIPELVLYFKCIRNIKKNKYLEMAFILFSCVLVLDYAKIPWSSHIYIYPYYMFLLIILLFSAKSVITKKQEQK